MKHNRPYQSAGVGMGTAVLALLFLLALLSGCENKTTANRAEEEKKFLAPTDVSKLTPEARAHLPGGGSFQPTNAASK